MFAFHYFASYKQMPHYSMTSHMVSKIEGVGVMSGLCICDDNLQLILLLLLHSFSLQPN